MRVRTKLWYKFHYNTLVINIEIISLQLSRRRLGDQYNILAFIFDNIININNFNKNTLTLLLKINIILIVQASFTIFRFTALK